MQDVVGEPRVFRVFGNLEEYARGTNDKRDPNHGLVKDSKEEPPTLEFMQSIIKERAAPLDLEASDMIWSTYFRINERMANGFRRRRAFIMGGRFKKNSELVGIYCIDLITFRCCSLSFACWRSRHEFGFTRWYVMHFLQWFCYLS